MKTMTATLTLIGTLTLGAGYALADVSVPVDPSANFAAHLESSGIVVDRMDGQQHGRLVSNYVPFTHRPPFLVEEGDHDVAALWRDGSTFTVRSVTDDGSGRASGEVTAEWLNDCIRFTFTTAEGEVFHTSGFRRQGWTGPERLGQPISNVVELPGVYVAEVRNSANEPVGWMRVEITSYGTTTRGYYASLPAGISGPLALAAFQRVDSEIDSVEQNATKPPARQRLM